MYKQNHIPNLYKNETYTLGIFVSSNVSGGDIIRKQKMTNRIRKGFLAQSIYSSVFAELVRYVWSLSNQILVRSGQ